MTVSVLLLVLLRALLYATWNLLVKAVLIDRLGLQIRGEAVFAHDSLQ